MADKSGFSSRKVAKFKANAEVFFILFQEVLFENFNLVICVSIFVKGLIIGIFPTLEKIGFLVAKSLKAEDKIEYKIYKILFGG